MHLVAILFGNAVERIADKRFDCGGQDEFIAGRIASQVTAVTAATGVFTEIQRCRIEVLRLRRRGARRIVRSPLGRVTSHEIVTARQQNPWLVNIAVSLKQPLQPCRRGKRPVIENDVSCGCDHPRSHHESAAPADIAADLTTVGVWLVRACRDNLKRKHAGCGTDRFLIQEIRDGAGGALVFFDHRARRRRGGATGHCFAFDQVVSRNKSADGGSAVLPLRVVLAEQPPLRPVGHGNAAVREGFRFQGDCQVACSGSCGSCVAPI